MASKLAAAELAIAEGTRVVIASGYEPNVIERILSGEDVGTQVLPVNPRQGRRQRIAVSGKKQGALLVNDGGLRALSEQKASLLPIGALLLVGSLAIGAETLKEFALALFIGVAVGTYSSIFIAAPILARWKEREPEWERQRRRSQRSGSATPLTQSDVAESIAATDVPATAARPPKQRRKRR